jgi:hypothetical protein
MSEMDFAKGACQREHVLLNCSYCINGEEHKS